MVDALRPAGSPTGPLVTPPANQPVAAAPSGGPLAATPIASPADAAALGDAATALATGAAGDLADLPWQAGGPPHDLLAPPGAAPRKAEQAGRQALADAWEQLGPAGQAAIEGWSGTGFLEGPQGRALLKEVGKFLTRGGDPAVAGELLGQLQDPDARITQAFEQSCGAATLQKALAGQDPARYFKLASDLVTTGSCTVATRTVGFQQVSVKMELSAANRAAADAPGLTPAERINAAFQAAAMDLANGGAQYDAASDQSVGKKPDQQDPYAGLDGDQVRALQGWLLGAKGPNGKQLARRERDLAAERAEAGQPPLGPEALRAEAFRAALERDLAKGRPGLAAVLEGPAGKHLVMVMGADATGFMISDGTGAPRHIDAADFGAAFVASSPTGAGGIGTYAGYASTGYASVARKR